MNDQEHKCQCDFRIRILGDGCRYCHPQKYIDRLYDTMDGMIHSIIVKLNGAGYYEAATMLRQQQAEIEALKYHPVKELTDEEIMDELVKVKHTWVATTSVWYEFEKEELKKAIRAILRKASEK